MLLANFGDHSWHHDGIIITVVCGIHRRSRVSLEKYSVSARTHFETEMDDRALYEILWPNAIAVDSPVHVAKFYNFDKISLVSREAICIHNTPQTYARIPESSAMPESSAIPAY